LNLEPLQTEIRALVDAVDGTMGVCVHDIASGTEVGVHADAPLPMASVCKIPILVSAYRLQEAGSIDRRAKPGRARSDLRYRVNNGQNRPYGIRLLSSERGAGEQKCRLRDTARSA
jgi:hypothetical protein